MLRISCVLCALLVFSCTPNENTTPQSIVEKRPERPPAKKQEHDAKERALTSKTFALGEGTFRYVVVDPERIEVHYRNRDGAYRTMHQLRKKVEANDPQVIMNAGIYEPGNVPSGLLVSDGEEQVEINRDAGKGNFFLKPNGVFGIAKKSKAQILRTEDVPKRHGFVHATQSGPLLIRRGVRHPKITAKSQSRKVRNGVGILKNGKVVLAIATGVNLFEFGSGFEKLGCKDVLYLDGTISRMWVKGDPDPRNEAWLQPVDFAGMLVAY